MGSLFQLRRIPGRVTVWPAALSVGVALTPSIAQVPVEIPQLQPPATAPPRGGETEGPVGTSEVRVSEYMTVDIIVQNDRVTNVLNKLAIQARRNIVPSPKVDMVINATIYGVPFYDALTGLLEPNALGFVERGEFIHVYTNDELKAMGLGAGAMARVIHLDYLRPADARTFAMKLLSPEGSIEITRDEAGDDAGGGGGGAGDAGAAGGGAAGAAGGGGGGGGGGEDEIYTPDKDEYDLRNAIIVHDYPENIDRVENFIKEIDTRPAQVLIEATIVQTTLTDETAFGVDFAVMAGVDFVDFFNFPVGDIPLGLKVQTDPENPGNIISPRLRGDGFAISDPGNTGAGSATIRGGWTHDNVGIFVRALDQVTDVTLLSNPKLLALNRQRSRVFVGRKVGYLETTVVENQVLQTVKFIDTGIILDIRPFILRDGRVRLELSPKVSDVEFREFTSSSGNVQEIPDEIIQTVTTDILVPAGYTAVIGGLFREDTTRARKQVPILGDIPLAGAAFRGHDDMTQQVEIVFLIKPTVLEDRIVIEQGDRGERYAERVRVGTRLGLLPWSRERQSARLNLEAERLFAAGELDKALYKVRRSLELRQMQPEVIRWYEMLSDEPAWWPTRSYLERMIDEELQGPPSDLHPGPFMMPEGAP